MATSFIDKARITVRAGNGGKKMAASGYKIRYTIDEALADWFRDSGGESMK